LTADVTKACNAVLPIVQALATAQRRDDLSRKISKVEGQNSTTENKHEGAPAVTSADSDPQATQVS
jgi:hypothetical protein